MKVSFDSSALIKLVLREPGWEGVERTLEKLAKDPNDEAIMAGPVLTEVIYRSRYRGNGATGRQLATALLAQGLRIEPATEADLIQAADLLEVSASRPDEKGATLSLGDATILAISERIDAKVLTGDKYWEWLVKQETLSIEVITL